MPRIYINQSATADKQAEIHDERTGAVLAVGFLQVDITPDSPGSIAGSLSFVAVEVTPKQPTSNVHDLLKENS